MQRALKLPAGALVLVSLVWACSAVPDVVYIDEDASPTPDASQDAPGDAVPSCVPVLLGVPLRCCGVMQCVGDGCDRCQAACGDSCDEPNKKYCCQNRGEFKCLDKKDDCDEKTR